MKAYHVIWNNPAKFSNIFLHLGDFHCMKAFFGVIGCYITGSGFEDIIYQSGLCQPGTIRSVLEGKHYNRAFLLHKSLAEVISRIFQDFIQFKVTAGDKINVSDIDNGLSDSTSALYIAKYSTEFKNGLSGAHGETAAYWLKYVDLVDSLHSLNYSLLANDFETRLAAWKELLPLFFYFDRTHYARYGTYYINSLENMELTHPGAKDELIKSGISVRRNKFGIGQAVDLAGEQTYMRNAKTSGGITQFQTRPGAVLKWVLNRPFQTEFVDALKESSGLDKTSTNPRKCLRPSEIMKSERIVTLLQSIIMNQFLSPFDSRLSKDQLFNIVSGKAVDTTILSSLKNSHINGNKALETFLLRLNQHGSASFFDPIARNKPKTFLDEKLKLKVKDASSKSEITVHRDVLGTLLAISNKCKKTVDIDKALKYPLSPVSAPLATCDGSIRKNAKSALLKSALSSLEEIDDNAIPSECDVYMIDLVAYVRTAIARCRTIRDIATELMKSIPHQFTTTYVLADNYEPNSIKSGYRQKRGSGTHYILNSPDMLVPYNVEEFLAVGENKETLFDLILRSICENPPQNKVLYFCSRQCTRITSEGSHIVHSLYCDHEEADTKIVAYAYVASAFSSGIVVRSPSGDIDIVMLLSCHQFRCSIYLDNGTSKNRKVFDLSDVDMSERLKEALIGLHSISGNDYISCFCRKGKRSCWKVCLKSDDFTSACQNLGKANEVTKEEENTLSKFVCALYGQKKAKDTNEARSLIFWDRYNKKGKISELSWLPPCSGNLSLHIKRSNYVALMYRKSTELVMNLPDTKHHGWDAQGNVTWMPDLLPMEYQQYVLSDLNISEEEHDDDDDNDLDDDGDDDIDTVILEQDL